MNPMVEEVNRLIGNLLAAGESVVLPEVGTLQPVKRAAQRLTKKLLLPPSRDIAFTAEVQGVTLPQRLAEAARCPQEQAEEIYGRWLEHTRTEEGVTLVGIGAVKGGKFSMEEAFDKRLNPQGHKPLTVRKKRGFDWMMAFGVLAILVAGGIAYYGYTLYAGGEPHESVEQPVAVASPSESTEVEATESATPTEEVAEVAVAPAAAVAEKGASASAMTPSAVVAEPAEPIKPTEPEPNPSVMAMVSGRYYVVLGVFSTVENAERAGMQAAEKDGTLRCGIFRFGSKWMVSPFESDDPEACTLFRKAHVDHFPEMWVYKAR
ncbi:MAG: SPOR domain-containing protein [Alistipes sp.]|nr:SPOR domain-containing protein [Alistipes sp.]